MVTPLQGPKLVVIGDKGMIVFADVLDKNNKLLFYNHDVSGKEIFRN